MENTQELIKQLYKISISKIEEMEASEDYDGRDYDYEQGYQNALEDLHQKLFKKYLGDLVD